MHRHIQVQIAVALCAVLCFGCGGVSNRTSTLTTIALTPKLPTRCVTSIAEVLSPIHPQQTPANATPFLSSAAPANGDTLYRGLITFTQTWVGVYNTYGVIITNTGTTSIPLRMQDFTLTLDANPTINPFPQWTPVPPGISPGHSGSWHSSAEPGQTVESDFNVYGNWKDLQWRIAGSLDVVTIPYTPPITPTPNPSRSTPTPIPAC